MSRIRDEEFDLCRQLAPEILAAGQRYVWRPEVIAAIISRESRFGLILDPDGTGDQGHGHGLMQIDDRSFGDWLANNDWLDPAVNIDMGVRVLAGKNDYLTRHFPDMAGAEAEQAAIAAYNCGEGNVAKALRAGADIDIRTTGHDYSADVLARAEEFKSILEAA